MMALKEIVGGLIHTISFEISVKPTNMNFMMALDVKTGSPRSLEIIFWTS